MNNIDHLHRQSRTACNRYLDKMSSNSNVIHNHYEHVLDAYKSDVYFTKTTEYKKQIQEYIIDLLNLQRLGDHNDHNDSNVISIVDLGTYTNTNTNTKTNTNTNRWWHGRFLC